MTDNTYNGWKNYETWVTCLWFDNDQGTNELWNTRAEEIYNESSATTYSSRMDVASSTLAKEMQDYVEEFNPVPACGLYADLLNSAISEVEWYDIAEHYLNEVDEIAVEAQEQWDRDNITSKD